jgi:hypothetical protein
MDEERMSRSSQEKCPDLSRRGEWSHPDSRGPLIDELRQQLRRWGPIATEESPVFSCGAAAIDHLLPEGGLRHGMLVEWVGEAAALSLLAAREACREGGVLVVIDRARTFYPPAAAAWGVDLERLIVVRPQNARDELWAAVQALRSPVVAALWAYIDRLDSRAFRRLQLAAEAGRTLGALVRPASARGQPSWAEMTFEASPLYASNGLRTADYGHFIQIRIVHCHNGRPGGSATLEIDDATYTIREARPTNVPHPLPVATELADSTSHSLPARA